MIKFLLQGQCQHGMVITSLWCRSLKCSINKTKAKAQSPKKTVQVCPIKNDENKGYLDLHQVIFEQEQIFSLSDKGGMNEIQTLTEIFIAEYAIY